MKKRRSHSNKWLAGAAAGLVTISAADASLVAPGVPSSTSELRRQASLDVYAFRHENVLGTSLDLLVGAAKGKDARRCERHVLDEIERLRAILSTYDAESEINYVRHGGAVSSDELSELLWAYELWRGRTGGAIQLNLADVLRLWKDAERAGQAPSAEALHEALRAPGALNVDALGKGLIVDRAVEVARQYSPTGLLDIGGDMRAWGEGVWQVAVANPASPGENARPLARFALRNAAVATSGGYARYYTIGGVRRSHVIDPRTLEPVDHVASATMIAVDCLTANALATAACVLGPDRGTRLAGVYAKGSLIVDNLGEAWRGGALDLMDLCVAPGTDETPPKNEPPAAANDKSDKNAKESAAKEKPADAVEANAAWPEGYQVAVNLSLKTPSGKKAKRPYVAVWIEDAGGKVVRTVTLWGKKTKYIREMSHWWRATDGDSDLIKSVTRATRAAGQYTIAWDGLDDAGKALPSGDYKIIVEIHREHGRHVKEAIAVACHQAKQSYKLRETAESDESTVEYGPRSE